MLLHKLFLKNKNSVEIKKKSILIFRQIKVSNTNLAWQVSTCVGMFETFPPADAQPPILAAHKLYRYC